MIKTLYIVTITRFDQNDEVIDVEKRSMQTFYQTRGWIANTMQNLTSGQTIDVKLELQQK